MLRQKSFVDESLFGNTSERRVMTASSNNHLSHNLMSNLAPLIVASTFKNGMSKDDHLDSARSYAENNSIKDNTQVKQLKPSKPWRP